MTLDASNDDFLQLVFIDQVFLQSDVYEVAIKIKKQFSRYNKNKLVREHGQSGLLKIIWDKNWYVAIVSRIDLLCG